MSDDPQHAEVWERWWRYAVEDLQTARQLAASDAPPRIACVLAQQAAEKAIKAALVHAQVDFPRTHDLLRLARLLPRPGTGR